MACGADFIGVYAENAVVVGGAVFKIALYVLRKRVAVGLAGFSGHVDTAERIYAAAQGAVGLKADDQLVFLVEIAGLIAGKRGYRLCVNV